MLLSVASSAISILSLTFAVYAWRQANRPLVTARITTAAGGNQGTALNILVENTGNRPARDIRLIASRANVQAALAAATQPSEIPKDAHRCFFAGISIPVLANGRFISNSFWHLGHPDSWRAGAEIPIKIAYRDLSGRRFTSRLRLFLADDAGFAQTFWESGSNAKG
nr:hypothetical protein [Zoogloeaceae bacterium]